MRKLLPLILGIFLLAGCASNTSFQQSTSPNPPLVEKKVTAVTHNYINIKYRDDTIDIGDPKFEHLNTSKSSFVRGAWYDKDSSYMVINLKGIFYHYCGLPSSTWYSFKKANSFGTYYNKYIYQNYDCRYNYVPTY